MSKELTENKIIETSEVKIKIPEVGGSLSIEEVKQDADSKFKDVNFVVYSVVIILLVMVATLLIDSFHFNSAVYKEYSEKINTLSDLQNTNKELLEQNIQNQKIIINLQNQMINKK